MSELDHEQTWAERGKKEFKTGQDLELLHPEESRSRGSQKGETVLSSGGTESSKSRASGLGAKGKAKG